MDKPVDHPNHPHKPAPSGKAHSDDEIGQPEAGSRSLRMLSSRENKSSVYNQCIELLDMINLDQQFACSRHKSH